MTELKYVPLPNIDEITQDLIWKDFHYDLTRIIKKHSIDSKLGLCDYQISDDIILLLHSSFVKYNEYNEHT